jgi:hypothetical protein
MRSLQRAWYLGGGWWVVSDGGGVAAGARGQRHFDLPSSMGEGQIPSTQDKRRGIAVGCQLLWGTVAAIPKRLRGWQRAVRLKASTRQGLLYERATVPSQGLDRERYAVPLLLLACIGIVSEYPIGEGKSFGLILSGVRERHIGRFFYTWSAPLYSLV